MYKVEVRTDKKDKIRVQTFNIEAKHSLHAMEQVSAQLFPDGMPSNVGMSANKMVESVGIL